MTLESLSATDETLFLRIKQGDEKAFDTLFLRYYSALCAYANHYIEWEDAEEVVQELMVWIWENKTQTFIGDTFKNYLFAAVRNRSLSIIARDERKSRLSHTMHESIRSLYENPDVYVVEELSRNIEAAISRLPQTYREAFELNRFENLTYKEIAEKLAISPKTVDYRIQQALKQLRTDLKDYLPLIGLFIHLH